MNKRHPGDFLKSITTDRAKDSGMALVLILLVAGIWSRDILYFKLAAIGLLLDMMFPMAYYPFAVIWFGLSRLLGAVMSKLLLVCIYALVVMPVALFRRLLGRDPFRLKDFKCGGASVFQTRDHIYRAEDLERPF